MAQTPLDRLQIAASWVAFLHLVVTALGFWLEEVRNNRHLIADYQYLLGGSELLLLGLSPTIWLILWITTGSPRFLPWKK